MEALSKLGIDVRLLIAQLVNFAILLFLLHRFLYKPLLAMLEKRRETIEKSLQEAKSIEERLATIEKQRETEIAHARSEAKEIIEKAVAHAEDKSAALLARTKEEVGSVVEHAREKIRVEKEQMLSEAKQELSSLILASVQAILHDVSDEKLSNRLTKEALTKVKL